MGYAISYASMVAIAVSALLGCALSLGAGELKPWISLLSLVVGLAAGIWGACRNGSLIKRKPISWPVALLYFVIGVGIYFHSVFLFYQKGSMLWIQNAFNLGDMSFHWGTIRFLGKGAHFWPENPIFLAHRFRYPFGMDFFNAFFENLHVPIAVHLPLVTLACLLILFYLLHVTGGPLLVFAVFFSGGYFNFWSPESWDVLQLQAYLDFKNLFLSVLLTQRGFLYALPAALLVFQGLKSSFEGALEGSLKPSLTEKISYGILWGALGFFHLHTFFFVSLVFGVWILWQRQLRTWLPSVGIAAVLGAPFVLNALWPDVDTNSLIHWSRGWARAEDSNLFLYWFKNMGPWIVAVVVGLTVFYRRRLWGLFIPLAFIAGLFLLFAHLILAPWNWDNIKLIMWCYVLALLLLSDWLWESRGRIVKVLVFLIFFGPGTLLFVRSLPLYTHGVTWTSAQELNKAEVLLSNESVQKGLVIAPEYEHPALLLGHKLFMGYPGHVWSHGYNYGAHELLLKRYFEGDETAVAELKSKGVELFFRSSLEKRRENGWKAGNGLLKSGEALDHELYKGL